MTHQISGSKINADVQNRLRKYLPNIQTKLTDKKVVIFQFELPPQPTAAQKIKYDAATTSTRQKQKTFQEFLGCQFECVMLPWNLNYDEAVRQIEVFNQDSKVKAIIIQNPIPKKLDLDEDKLRQIKQRIAASKDIDAMSEAGEEKWGRCATADAICRVIQSGLGENPELGVRVALIGSKGFVGGGIASYLQEKSVTYNGIDTQLGNSEEINELNKPDIIVIASATGKSELLNEKHIKPTHKLVVDCTFVIDGLTPDGKPNIKGDVARTAYDIPQFITPVPGGIGPMEMAVLLERFMVQEFPELQLDPWQLKPLDDLTAEDLASGNYLSESSLSSQKLKLSETIEIVLSEEVEIDWSEEDEEDEEDDGLSI